MPTSPLLLDRARLGPPITSKALTMVPIHLDGAAPPIDYMPLGQAIASGRARLAEISEGGSVPLLAVRNDSDVALFILDGEELIGAKQNRVVNLSILVPPKSVLPIPVSCVERGRWSYRTRGFDVSPNTLFAGGRADQMAAVTSALRRSGRRDGNQGQVWGAVDQRMTACGVGSPTSSMKDVYDAQERQLAELLAGLKSQPGQAGAVFALDGRIIGMELFEGPEMFAAYFNKIARGYALDAVAAPSAGGGVDLESAEELLQSLRGAAAHRFKAVGLGDDVRIDDLKVQGGALLLDERLVHLAAFRRRGAMLRETVMQQRPTSTQRRPPSIPQGPTLWAALRKWFGA
jgi:hypothetical protein